MKNLKESYSQENSRRDRNKFYLAPLVPKGTEINLEEEKIKEKINNEHKRNKRRIELRKNRTNKSLGIDTYQSKYPLGKKKYDNIKRIEQEESQKSDYKINDYDKIHVEVPANLLQLWKQSKNDANKSQTVSTYIDIISKKSNCGPYFLPAYNKIAEKEIRRINSVEKRNRLTKTFEYTHPGTYREFIFTENEINHRDDNTPVQKTKKVKVYLWSCCLNNDKNSKGCQKKTIRNFRWIYEP
jgi:hypothetical protein